MRDAAGDIAPGGHALRRYKFGHIIEGDDIAFKVARLVAAHAKAHQKAFLLALARQAHFFLHRSPGAFAQPVKKGGKLGHGGGKGHVGLAIRQIKQTFRGPVDEVDVPAAVQTDHASGDV